MERVIIPVLIPRNPKMYVCGSFQHEPARSLLGPHHVSNAPPSQLLVVYLLFRHVCLLAVVLPLVFHSTMGWCSITSYGISRLQSSCSTARYRSLYTELHTARRNSIRAEDRSNRTWACHFVSQAGGSGLQCLSWSSNPLHESIQGDPDRKPTSRKTMPRRTLEQAALFEAE